MVLTPDPDERQRYVELVQSSTPLDGVFWALDYNRLLALPERDAEAFRLDPARLLPGLDAEVLGQYVLRADALFRWEAPLGKAFFGYPGHPRSYEEEVDLFVAGNPGFSEAVYGAVANRGILVMR